MATSSITSTGRDVRLKDCTGEGSEQGTGDVSLDEGRTARWRACANAVNVPGASAGRVPSCERREKLGMMKTRESGSESARRGREAKSRDDEGGGEGQGTK